MRRNVKIVVMCVTILEFVITVGMDLMMSSTVCEMAEPVVIGMFDREAE